MRVAVVGSRQCGDLDFLKIKQNLPEDCTEIVSGGAHGVDTLAKKCAEEYGYRYTEFLPDYATHGRTAPLVRNRLIVDHSDFVLAFWDYKSNGTRSTLAYALEQDKPVKIILL
ncbi:MAG: SLOG family protein [Massilioclostridium sp.]|nr:SLOG family protein [Massilioclostridium sp.]